MVMTLTALLATPALAQEALLTDFAGGGAPLRWMSVNDNVMGGRSLGGFEVEDGTLVFSGSLNTNGGGFASVRTQPGDLALKGKEGLRLRVRGDGRTYTAMVRTGSRRSISYRASFETTKGEWQDIWLPFRDMTPSWRGRTLDMPAIDPAKIRGVGLMIADKIDGPFRLEVASIHAYRPFSFDAYEWKNRPLVVFAPRIGDARLTQQIDAVQRSSAECIERAMVLVVVLGDGTAFAGSRPLSSAQAEELRKRFDVARDDFAVKLVGKDGGVKRSAADPVDLKSVFAQIDDMPMRRAEMSR